MPVDAPNFDALYGATSTKTYTSAFASANAIVTSLATSASPVTLSGGSLNGSIGAGAIVLSQTISATTSVHASSYVLTPITVNGTDESGATISDTITLTLVNGGETISTSKGFASVTSIVIPAQHDALGAWTFGVRDVALVKPARAVRGGAAGNVKMAYQDATVDTLPFTAGEVQCILPVRLYDDGGTTAWPVTVYR